MGFFQSIQNFDFTILNFIQDNMRNAFLDIVLAFITKLGNDGNIWAVIAVLLFFDKKYRKYSLMLAASLILSLIIGDNILKPLFHRDRPFAVNPDVQLLIPKLKSYSFPSGHAMSSFASAAILWYADKKKFGIAALILALIIAFSRLYLYVHYPSDVIVGAILGVLLSLFVIGLYKNIKKRRNKNNKASAKS